MYSFLSHPYTYICHALHISSTHTQWLMVHRAFQIRPDAMDNCSVCHIREEVVEYGGALCGGFWGMFPHLFLYIFQLILLSKTLIH